ncbi:hypothetical protein C8R47DRAFT_1074218 [Mycena vitilis]|nr:hypothetical protein C8R47DRAFT_1074218 [Mycena vitilis]
MAQRCTPSILRVAEQSLTVHGYTASSEPEQNDVALLNEPVVNTDAEIAPLTTGDTADETTARDDASDVAAAAMLADLLDSCSDHPSMPELQSVGHESECSCHDYTTGPVWGAQIEGWSTMVEQWIASQVKWEVVNGWTVFPTSAPRQENPKRQKLLSLTIYASQIFSIFRGTASNFGFLEPRCTLQNPGGLRGQRVRGEGGKCEMQTHWENADPLGIIVVNTVLLQCLVLGILLLTCAALGINLYLFAVAPVLNSVSFAGRGSSDAPASVSCPAWQDSLIESCPRPDPGVLLLEFGPNLCPTDARRGDVEFMARGWMRTSLALDAKRFMKISCLPSTRRGLVARPFVGICSLVGSLIGMIKYKSRCGQSNSKLNNLRERPFKRNECSRVATNPSPRFVLPRWVAGANNILRTLSSLARGAHNYFEIVKHSNFRRGTMPAVDITKPIPISESCVSCGDQPGVPSFVYADREACDSGFECRCSLTYGGGLRQTISGRLLSPHLVEDNGIVAWIHREYVFESQLDMPVSSMLDLLTKGDERIAPANLTPLCPVLDDTPNPVKLAPQRPGLRTTIL